MSADAGDDLDARLDALALRLDDSLARVQAWIEPLVDRAGESGGVAELRAKLRAAESSANLQVQRCVALEDRIVELEAALVGARDRCARAEALAETARHEADRALDELERARSEDGERSGPYEASLGEALQARLLEIERLSRERDTLRRSCDELRSQARELRRERDESTLGLERAASQLEELRERDAATRAKLAELERTVAAQQRELEIAERRAKHLREHLSTGSR